MERSVDREDHLLTRHLILTPFPTNHGTPLEIVPSSSHQASSHSHHFTILRSVRRPYHPKSNDSDFDEGQSSRRNVGLLGPLSLLTESGQNLEARNPITDHRRSTKRYEAKASTVCLSIHPCPKPRPIGFPCSRGGVAATTTPIITSHVTAICASTPHTPTPLHYRSQEDGNCLAFGLTGLADHLRRQPGRMGEMEGNNSAA